MNHLKKFENFYVDNDTSMESDEQEYLDQLKKSRSRKEEEEEEEEDCDSCDIDSPRKKVWGDEVVEGKKTKDKKKKEDKKEEEVTGLTPKQKKLPIGLQKAILKRMKNKK